MKWQKNKSRESCLKHYGVEHPSQSEIIKKKKIATTLEHYGVENPFQAEEVKQKIKETCLEKYGVENAMQNKIIRNKGMQLGLENGKFPSSKQQRYLCNLFNGELNKLIKGCVCDIILEDKKIAIEYDGSGHWLCMKLGNISLEQFNEKEKKRENKIINAGYKLIRIISRKDLLPQDEIIIKLINEISTLSDKLVKIDIDNNYIIYENKIESYKFNDLKSIKENKNGKK